MHQVEGYGGFGTTEAGEATGPGAQVADCSAEFGGDGLAFDEEELWFCEGNFLGRLFLEGEQRCGWVLGVCDFGFDDSYRGWSFDHGEGCYD